MSFEADVCRRPALITAQTILDLTNRIHQRVQEVLLTLYGRELGDYLTTKAGVKELQTHPVVLAQFNRHGSPAIRAIREHQIMRLWRASGSTVYDMNADLVLELLDTDLPQQLPPDVFSTLPHRNPMLVFTTGIPILTPDGEVALLRAAYVSGCDDTGMDIGTHDEESSGVRVMVVADLMNDQGHVVDVEMSTFMAQSGDLDIASMVERAAQGYQSMEAGLSRDKIKAHMFSGLSILIPILLYLASTDTDIVERGRIPASKRKPGTAKSAEPAWKKVGYAIGPALKRSRVAYAVEAASTVGKRKVRPHQRRAHFHTYKIGPGRQGSVVKWLYPFWVGGKQAPVPTIHKAR